MFNWKAEEPVCIKNMTNKEGHHAGIKELHGLSTREQKQYVAKAVKQQCQSNEHLVVLTPKALWKEKLVNAAKKEHEKRLCQSVHS